MASRATALTLIIAPGVYCLFFQKYIQEKKLDHTAPLLGPPIVSATI